MLRAQETGHRGRGGYSQLTISGANEPAPFPQAQVESRDFESFFRLFPDYLIRDALAGKEVLDFGSGYGGRTVEYKLCGAKRVKPVQVAKHFGVSLTTVRQISTGQR
jgi:hypothetical protein